MDTLQDEKEEFSNLIHKLCKTELSYQQPTRGVEMIAHMKGVLVPFPEDKSAFDFYFDSETKSWKTWAGLAYSSEPPPRTAGFNLMLVPTTESVARMKAWLPWLPPPLAALLSKVPLEWGRETSTGSNGRGGRGVEAAGRWWSRVAPEEKKSVWWTESAAVEGKRGGLTVGTRAWKARPEAMQDRKAGSAVGWRPCTGMDGVLRRLEGSAVAQVSAATEAHSRAPPPPPPPRPSSPAKVMELFFMMPGSHMILAGPTGAGKTLLAQSFVNKKHWRLQALPTDPIGRTAGRCKARGCLCMRMASRRDEGEMRHGGGPGSANVPWARDAVGL